ncbi:TPA: hypothetical protein JG871_004247 [Enterobacter hormaechei subsp. xiangfangensis]|nr:hypothetical protein [Enterobacter hormaechei subsp. xiangfangensis]
MAFELVTGVNSYVSSDEVAQFLQLEGITAPDNVDYLAYKALLKLDNGFSWLGRKLATDQPLQFPRGGLCDSAATVPDAIKQAQLCLLAHAITTKPEPGISTGQSLRRKKVGQLEIEYFESQRDNTNTAFLDSVMGFVRPYAQFGVVAKRV